MTVCRNVKTLNKFFKQTFSDMATIKTRYLGNLRTEMTHLQSGSVVLTDAPTDNNGKGEAFSPTDLVAGALASCMLTIMGIAANTHGFSIEGTTVEITKIMSATPRRIGEIVVTFNIPQEHDAKTRTIIENAAKTCPVEHSLHPDIKRTITFNYGTK